MTKKIRNYTIVAICSLFMVGLIGGTALAGTDNLHYKGGQYYYDVDQFDTYQAAPQSGNVQAFNTRSSADVNSTDNMHYQGGQYYYNVDQFGSYDNASTTTTVREFNTKSAATPAGADNMHYKGGQYYYDVEQFN